MNDEVFDVLEAVLGENTEADYRVVENGNAVEIRVNLYESLDGVNKLPVDLKDRLTLSFDGNTSVLTLKKKE